MCGIAGLLLKNPAGPASVERLIRMCDSMRHRGPDGEGYWIGNGSGTGALSHEPDPTAFPRGALPASVFLGHRRLSIIDLAGGAQPLSNEDGTVWVTYNGEIYNYLDLQADLVARGHTFHTHSDTEVLVHGWEEWGEGLVERLRGMFAFGIWDTRSRTLFLARDRLGIKPLYYASAGDRFLFASELQAVRTALPSRPSIDSQALYEYLIYDYIPSPLTIYRGVRKLSPGHALTVRLGQPADPLPSPSERPYWSLRFEPDEAKSFAAWTDELRHHLDEAVRIRLMSEVPLGAFLSGGVDSSTVVGAMSGLLDSPVRTFCIGFADRSYNETEYARIIAERFRTDHRELTLAPSLLDLFPTVVDIYGEPFADSSAVPTYYVSKLAREGVTVALSGDGGDEVFAGYTRYGLTARYDRMLASWPKALFPLLRAAAFLPSKKIKRVLRQSAEYRPDWWYHDFQMSRFPIEERLDLLSPEVLAEIDQERPRSRFASLHASQDGADLVSRLQYIDLKTYLPDDILTKVDRASMIHSLEVRVPLLDHRLIEWAARVPVRFKLTDGHQKILLKEILRPTVGQAFLDRPKMGFGMPVGEWVRGELRPLVDDLFAHVPAGWIRPEAARAILDRHLGGGENLPYQVWNLMVLIQWLRRYEEERS